MRNTSEHQGNAALRLLSAVMLAVAINAPSFAQQMPAANVVASESTSRAGWISTGKLDFRRTGHAATLLPNGKVLVVGGISWEWYESDTYTYETSAELYDPATGSWTQTGSPKLGRWGHTATLLLDGKVLVVGGLWGQRGDAELYDPATGIWTLAGSPQYARSSHTATRMADGRVLVVGEEDAPEVYDPATGSWTAITGLSDRSSHTATLLGDGRILVLGGFLNGVVAFPSVYLYDPRTGNWATGGTLVFPRYAHTATLLPSGKVLVAGGAGVGRQEIRASELYDPATGTSLATGDLNFPRVSAVATPLSNGDVLITGGVVSALRYANVASAEIYDTTTGKWLSAGQQITPRYGHTATLLQDSHVLVAGGTSNAQGPLASVELYENFPPGTIGPGYTGSWYDPAQLGHGLFVEVLPDNQFLAAWFTFDPAGTHQSWFLGVGTYSGDTATVSAVYQPTGGRWIPNFDPARVVNKPWGTLKFTFTDCNRGKVEFASTSGYGTGNMNLTRLTQPAGLTCP